MDPVALRVARRFVAKTQTYEQAKAAIIEYLATKGWSVKDGLKVPHATAPDKSVRLWFRPQAIYFTTRSNLLNYGDARSLWTENLRSKTPEQFYHEVEHAMQPGGWFESTDAIRSHHGH